MSRAAGQTPESATGTGASAATETAKPPAVETDANYKTGKTGTDISNELINIVVNARDADTGRFSLTTKKGDPTRPIDDNKMLIYGEAIPWTSFTTVRIDGKDYVFGGSTKRRAGKSAEYGKIIEAPGEQGGVISMKCQFGGIIVTQKLDIVSGPISGLYDTMRVSYVVENTDTVSHTVGVRVLLDTLLGNNDGAPFKVGERSIQRELMLSGDKIPEYWIAFDSLEKPGVISRGTLRGAGLIAPDKIIFANWGKFADFPWDVPYKKGQSFIRAAEDELDSATALYWDEKPVAPGGSLTVTTLYGIEYLNISVDVLSIGTLRDLGKWPTAPNQIKQYAMYAYVKNTVDFDMDDVNISLKLPDGLKLSEGDDGTRHFAKLQPGHEVTVGWKIEPLPFSGADDAREITIFGNSRQVREVKVKTRVMLLAAPDVKITVDAPTALQLVNGKEYGPEIPFPVEVHCFNSGLSSVDNLTLKMTLPAGLSFPAAQKAEKAFARLEGRDEVVFTWKLIADGSASGDLKYTIDATSESTQPKSAIFTVNVPPLPTKVEIAGVPATAAPGVFFPAEIFASNLRNFDRAEFSVIYDPNVVDVVYVSQGTAFVEGLQATPWKDPAIDNKKGIVSGISGSRGGGGFTGNGSLAVIHFRTKGKGKTAIEARGLKIFDAAGAPVEFVLDNAQLEVKE